MPSSIGSNKEDDFISTESGQNGKQKNTQSNQQRSPTEKEKNVEYPTKKMAIKLGQNRRRMSAG